jgi:hypothetical protein
VLCRPLSHIWNGSLSYFGLSFFLSLWVMLYF